MQHESDLYHSPGIMIGPFAYQRVSNGGMVVLLLCSHSDEVEFFGTVTDRACKDA